MKPRILILLTAGTALLASCSGGNTQARSSNGATQDIPEFMANTRAGCGTGSGKMRGDFNFARDQAATNARAELGKSIQTKLEGLYKQYRAEGETGGKDMAEEQSSKALRELLDIELTGTRITHAQVMGGFVYTEVCIDSKSVEAYIQNMKTLNESQKRALQTRAKAAFNELDEALDKKAQKEGGQ